MSRFRSTKPLVILLVTVMILGLLPTAAFAASFKDVEGHWAQQQIETWLQKGLAGGYPDGTFRPNQPVTRAEFATFANRAFGIKAEGGEEVFSDVSAEVWYSAEINAAKNAGYISGYPDGTFRPNNPITRQEAAVIVAKLLDLQGGAGEEFADHQAIAPWAKEAVEAVRAAGIMGGYPDGTFKPQNSITRAETVVTLQKALEVKEPGKEFEKVFDQAGVYGPEEGREVIEGDAAVTAPGVTLQNITITGDLLLDEGIGDGDVTLKGVTVKGETIVRGGGSNSINLENSNLARLTVTKEGVRIVASGSTRVTVTTLESGAILVSVTDDESGGFQNVIISEEIAPQAKITLEGDFAEVNVKGAVSELEIADGNVKEINIEAPVKVTGEGTITTANIEENGVEIEQKPKKTNISEGVTATVAGEEVKGDKTPSLGGGGGGSRPFIPVSAISVDPVEMYLELDKTATIKATVLPGNATNKRVTWTTSDKSIATVANGVVTPVAVGEATITATTVDGGFIATCVVSVINPISESADVVAGDFGVMNFSHVVGYNVGFVLSDATASDVKRVVITLYGAEEKVLATNTSAGILEQYSDATSLSAPFDVFGNFDYVEDGCWDYSGWQVDNNHIPTKATITVTFKNGVEKTVTNDNHPTGDISIFSKKVVNTNTLVGYDTIQEAINAAEPGHVLNVAPGTYEEPVIINKANLTVKSTAGAEKTILDGDRKSVTLVNIKADGVTFSGFTLQNAQKGISINSSNNSITNNIVADISYWSIELNGTGNYLEGNLVKDQGSWGEERQPRGIFLYRATNAKLRNNKLVNAGFSSGSGSNLATHDIDASNTVNGKPVYYWVGKTEETVPTDAGMAWLINCDKMTVQGLHIDSTERAIYVSGGSHHKILNNVLGDAHGSTFPKQKNITHRAIWVTSINDSEISYNTIISARSGIEVEAGNNNIVSKNTVTDSRQAIVFNGGEGNSARGNVLVNFIPDENYVYEPARWTAGFTVWNSAKDTRLEGNYLANFEWGINQQIDPRSGGEFSAFGTVARDNIIIGSIRCPAATNPISDRVLDARYNYWGFKEGPYHSVTNPDGQGQPIGDNILFYPWYENEDLTHLTLLDAAIEEAIATKEGIVISEEGADVPAGTYWVTQEDMDALDAAIAEAEAAKESAETQQDVAEAVEALEAAVSTFNDAKQEAIDEEEIGASEEGEEPVQGEELADDEESVEDEEAVEGEEQEE